MVNYTYKPWYQEIKTIDHSLILHKEPHKTIYTENYGDDSDIESDVDVDEYDPTNTQIPRWEDLKNSIPIEEWDLLNDIFIIFKTHLDNHFKDSHYNNLKLTEICAIEIGINIGFINSNKLSVEESKINEIEVYNEEWYNHEIVKRYTKWVIFGHLIGLIFANFNHLKNLKIYLFDYSFKFGLQKNLIKLYLADCKFEEIFNDYYFFYEFYSNLNIDYLELVLSVISNKLININQLTNSNSLLCELINLNSRQYSNKLSLILKIIELNSNYLLDIPKLVETLKNFNKNQTSIINSIFKFIKILDLNSKELNVKFLNNIYNCLKIGNFKSLIPLLKLIKSFILEKSNNLILLQFNQLSLTLKSILKSKLIKNNDINSKKLFKIINNPLVDITTNLNRKHIKSKGDLI